MHPEKAPEGPEQTHAEAVEDGTALLGHGSPGQVDPDGTDRLDGSGRSGNGTADEIGRAWHRISGRIAELFSTGVAENDQRTQETIAEHYRWICNFWTPDRDSYIRLAQMYVNQPKFRKRIERKKPAGMAAYMRDAMTAYAWSQLR